MIFYIGVFFCLSYTETNILRIFLNHKVLKNFEFWWYKYSTFCKYLEIVRVLCCKYLEKYECGYNRYFLITGLKVINTIISRQYRGYGINFWLNYVCPFWHYIRNWRTRFLCLGYEVVKIHPIPNEHLGDIFIHMYFLLVYLFYQNY